MGSEGASLKRPAWATIVSAVQTGGTFELFEETRETQSGPPPHVHSDRDETFFVLEGRYAFTRGSDEIELEPGGSVFVPRGERHLFRTLTAPARTLIIVSPAGLEAFFREMAEWLDAGATPLEAMTALAPRHDAVPVV